MNICVIGGLGYVGRGMVDVYRSMGHTVTIYDIAGKQEPGNLISADAVIVATPEGVISELLQSLVLPIGQLLIIRSTLIPGQFAEIEGLVPCAVAYCPERSLEGKNELRGLPQIVGVRTDVTWHRTLQVMAMFAPTVIRVTPEEAELAKLFCNAWRHNTYAIANDFYRIAEDRGLNYETIRNAATRGYPRCTLPKAGMVGGPCLTKDAAIVAGGDVDSVTSAALRINAAHPVYLAEQLGDISGKTVGLLGMAFKPESDDIRNSPSYLLRDALVNRGATVLCADPYVDDPSLTPIEIVLAEADVLVKAVAHKVYDDIA